MLNTSMFIIGGIIFLIYITSLLYMINWANQTQDDDMIADAKDLKKDSKKN